MSFTNQQYCCITYKDKFHNEYVTLWKDIIHSKGPQKTHRTQYFLRLFLALLPPGNQQLFRQPQRLQIQQKPLGCRSCQGKGGHGARPLGQTCGFLQRGARSCPGDGATQHSWIPASPDTAQCRHGANFRKGSGSWQIALSLK
ncbi:hypothetical protein Q9966_011666 [Columba livia]|nr:hypothetical protein Q9966_011666 [Columba livia]